MGFITKLWIFLPDVSSIQIGGIKTVWPEKIPPKKLVNFTRFYCLHTTFQN